MTTDVDRRRFLLNVARVTGGAVLAPSLAGLAACNLDSALPTDPALNASKRLPRAGKGFGGYGPLSESPDCPELLIPEGFTCVKLSTTFAPSLADPGFTVPAALDGMAAFHLSRDRIRLVRNHEIRNGAGVVAPFGPNPYDPAAGAGTTTLEVKLIRERRRGHRKHHRTKAGGVEDVELVAEFPSLTGTFTNCAGGPTPWGSWITCEETTAGTAAGFTKPHGYVFEVPAMANGPVDPVPLPAMGRLVHEALAVDPYTGFIYLTEDRSIEPGSGLYRFIPKRGRHLEEGGRLQVLVVAGQDNYDTATGQTLGRILPVKWVDIEDPDPANAEADTSAVFREGLAKGAAIFERLEGCWYGDRSIYFNATSGGDAELGQVWQYRPRGGRRDQRHGIAGTLSLVFESPGVDVLEAPDNITVSPSGGIVLCEDGDDVQFVRGLTRRGEIFDLVQTNGNLTEFAGATFSADGEVLFFNMQGSTSALGTDPGFTFALIGPWEEGALG